MLNVTDQYCISPPTSKTDPKASIGRCYQSPGSCLCNFSSRLLQLPALWFSKYQLDRLRRILSSCSYPHCQCLVPKLSHHTRAFIIYIVYQCPSATSANRPRSSRWYWSCLPKEISKFQGEWSLQFKI